MKELFTKNFINRLKKYAKSYYKANKQKLVKNEVFERCRDPFYEHLRCNTCQFKDECMMGKEYFEDNNNIIEETIEEMINVCKEREKKLNSQIKPKAS